MREELLTRYMEVGFPHLKEVAKLPEQLIPDFSDVARTLGDDRTLGIGEPLGLAERIQAYLARAPDPSGLSAEAWQKAIAKCPQAGQVLPVAMALLRACEKIEALERKGAVSIDSTLLRGLAVIAYAPFPREGTELLSELADILGGTAAEPAGLLERYTVALEAGDRDTMVAVEKCIMDNESWREWAERFVAAGQGFPFDPKVIGVTPSLTSGLKHILVTMMMEAIDADESGNYPN